MTECPPLTELPPNTLLVTVDQVQFLIVDTYARTVGTTVNVRCQVGLVLEGPSTVRCLQSGFWSADPYCTFPTEATTATPTSGMDDSTILLIVLAVVGFLVASLILFVCVALFWGRSRRKKNKQSRDSDFYLEEMFSQPYSISGTHRDNLTMYNTPVAQKPPSYSQEQPRQQNNQKQNQRPHDMEEVIPTADNDNDNRRYYQNRDKRNPQYKYTYGSQRYDGMRHAHSANDIRDESRQDIRSVDDEGEKHIRDQRRDRYLWQRRSSFSNLKIPRPYYELSGLPQYIAYYGTNLPADI